VAEPGGGHAGTSAVDATGDPAATGDDADTGELAAGWLPAVDCAAGRGGCDPDGELHAARMAAEAITAEIVR
jgi:hypothetical protein